MIEHAFKRRLCCMEKPKPSPAITMTTKIRDLSCKIDKERVSKVGKGKEKVKLQHDVYEYKLEVFQRKILISMTTQLRDATVCVTIIPHCQGRPRRPGNTSKAPRRRSGEGQARSFHSLQFPSRIYSLLMQGCQKSSPA